MELISDRVSILDKEGVYSLVMLPGGNKWKVNLLFAWIIAWTFSGIIFITTYINLSREGDFYRYQYNLAFSQKKTEVLVKLNKDLDVNQKKRLFFIGLMAFWVYFEYKTLRVYAFRKFGKEKLWLKGGKLFYKREIGKRGKVKEYNPELVNDLELIKPNKGDFFMQVQDSFWVIGGERVMFKYGAKFVKFGIQLSDEEANAILKSLKRVLKKYQ